MDGTLLEVPLNGEYREASLQTVLAEMALLRRELSELRRENADLRLDGTDL